MGHLVGINFVKIYSGIALPMMKEEKYIIASANEQRDPGDIFNTFSIQYLENITTKILLLTPKMAPTK
jgi:hypothetical protein